MKSLLLSIFCAIMMMHGVPTVLGQASPYAGQETRAIKALSKQQVENYLQGRGMGLARAAELNSFPGPRHVLELADELDLTDQQRERTEALVAQVKNRAPDIGRRIVDKERQLDGLLAEGTIDEARMTRLLDEIADLQARLRAVHLGAHIDQRQVLTPEQIEKYDALRGYGANGMHARHHSEKQKSCKKAGEKRPCKKNCGCKKSNKEKNCKCAPARDASSDTRSS